MKRILKKLSHNRIILCMLIISMLINSDSVSVCAKTESYDLMDVRVGYYYIEGYQEMSEEGERTGYGYDFLQMISGYGNLDYDYIGYEEGLTAAEMEDMLEEGSIDILTRIVKTPERQEKFDFTEYSVGTSSLILSAYEGSEWYQTFNEHGYDKMRVGMVRNSDINTYFEEYAEEHNIDYTAVYFDTLPSLAQALKEGNRIDTMASTSLRMIDDEIVLEKIRDVSFYACVKKGNSNLLNRLNSAMDSLNSINPSWKKDLELKYFSSVEKNGLMLTVKERQYLNKLLEDNTVLKVLVNPDHVPYSMVVDGNPEGIVVDVFDEVANMLGIAYEYIIPEGIEQYDEQIKMQTADIILDVNFDFAEGELLGYQLTNSYLTDSVAAIHRSGYYNEYKTVAVREGDEAIHPINQYGIEDRDVLLCDSAEACVDAVIKGKADVTYTGAYLAQQEVQLDYRGRVAYSYMPSEEMTFRIGIKNQRDSTLFMLINEGLFALGNERIQSIISTNTQIMLDEMTLDRFLYKNPSIFIVICLVLLCIIILIFVLGSRHKMIQNEREQRLKVEAAARREKEARKAVQEAFDAAKRANAAKTEFLANMSHDIRTPMNAIMGMTMIAETHIDDKERIQDCLNKITVSGKHLLGLINEVLDMSKIESGKVDLQEGNFSLSDLIDNLIMMSKPLMEQKNQKFNITISQIDHENVVGDEQRIQQAFMNLMSNAVKYTQEGGSIRLSISEKPTHRPNIGCYEFVFEDNGIGMSKEYIEHIFEPFTREHNEQTYKTQGTGLGMAITQNIIHMMNGNIQVESELKKGSKFTVTIFLKIKDMDDNINIELLENLPVLVADDDKITCESTCEMLEELGMNGEWVLTGKEAVDKTEAHHNNHEDYFAVILDWKMPDMDGVETAREIRKRAGEDVPIIIISAYDWLDIETEARQAGVNAFITKPLFKSRMAYLFNELLGNVDTNENQKVVEKFSEQNYTGKRALLTEDNDFNSEIAGEILGMTGLAIDYAKNGKEAVDILLNAEPGYYDIVFMDIQMPVMNGYEATKTIRGSERDDLIRLPIIAMTANAYAQDVQEAERAGMNGHIAKPLEMDRLLETLKKWLSEE